MAKVPELSLKAYTHGSNTEKLEFVDQLFAGLKEYGFIILKDHPIDVSLLRKAYALSEALFALPVEEKKKLISPAGGGQRGYTPFGQEHAKNSKLGDLKEFWHVGRDLPADRKLKKFFPDNIWPEQLKEFERTFRQM